MKRLLFLLLLVSGCCRVPEPQSPPLGTGNCGKPSLIVGGKEYVDSLKAMIDRAEKSIYIEIYEFKNDSTGNDIMSHLLTKAGNGVSVHLVLDGWGSAGQWDGDTLPGIEISMWDSFDFPYVNHILRRNHRKAVIIDGKDCLIGCTNIADYYISGLPEIGSWHDMAVKFPAGSAEIVKEDGEILSEWIRLLDSARQTVRIINPYIAPPKTLEEAIRRAIDRGVDVSFLFGENGDIDSYFRSSKSFLSRIGAKAWIYPEGFHHTKAMSIDGTTLFIGSANMTRRALCRNLEENLVIHDNETIRRFDSIFTDYVSVSHPLNAESISLADRLYDRLSFLIID